MLRYAFLALALLALLVAACGDGDDENDRADYEAALTALVERTDTDVEALVEPLVEALTFGSEATQLRLVQEIVPQLAGVREGFVKELEQLDPPRAYADDHARYVEGQRERIRLLGQIVAAAAAGDALAVTDLELALRASERDTLNDLSPEFVALAFRGEAASLFAQLAGGLTEEEQAYIEGLVAGQREFGRRAQAFGIALQRSYPTAESLLSALAGAGAGEAMQAAYDVVVTLTPPDSYVDDHALVVAYFEDAVAIDRTIGEAARSGDAATFLVANYELGAVMAPVIFDLSPAVCTATFAGAASLCSAAIEIPDDPYERELRIVMREFAVRFPPIGPWGSFELLPAGSEEPVMEAASVLAPRVIAVIDETRQSLAALDPPAELAADHERLLAYFDELRAIQEAIAAAAEAGDAMSVRAEIAATVVAHCGAAADLTPAAQLAVGFYFGASPDGRGGLCGPA